MIELEVTTDQEIALEVCSEQQIPVEVKEQIIYGGGGITPVGTKTIEVTENGTVTEDVTYYADVEVDVNVPNTYSVEDEGKVVDDGSLVSQTARTVAANNTYDTTTNNSVTVAVPASAVDSGTKNISSNGTHDVVGYANASVSVPNTYTAGDEGKVVSDGSLVSQTSAEYTENGTYDTTLVSSVEVSVPGDTPTGTKEIEITENGTTTESVAGYAYAEIEVDVPNTYSQEDEGKVVEQGELVSQSSATYTYNDTYDTTLIKSVTVNVSGGSPTLETVTKTYTPTESTQTEQITPSSGYDGLAEVDVTVNAIPSSYVGSGIDRNDSTDLTASGATVTAPAGYYESAAAKTVASGTAGTPTATKGTVSNHSVSVTPSVTNSAGYISSETKTGTAVTVSASELVSGTKSITENGTGIDVTDYAAVDVAVSGGGGFDFFDLSEPQGDITTSATVLGNSSAYGRTGITSITSATVTKVYTNAMYGCTGLQEINLPSLIGFGGDSAGSSSHTSAFRGCTSLSTVKAPSAQWVQGQTFYGCTSLQTIVLPSCTKISNQCFYGDNHLKAADFGGATFQTADQNIFNNCSAFDTLIIRASSVATLSNINHFTGTPFASNGTGGTLYVPQSLISSYQSATNWSTILGYANNSIVAIEGSQYENYYADGTPIS